MLLLLYVLLYAFIFNYILLVVGTSVLVSDVTSQLNFMMVALDPDTSISLLQLFPLLPLHHSNLHQFSIYLLAIVKPHLSILSPCKYKYYLHFLMLLLQHRLMVMYLRLHMFLFRQHIHVMESQALPHFLLMTAIPLPIVICSLLLQLQGCLSFMHDIA